MRLGFLEKGRKIVDEALKSSLPSKGEYPFTLMEAMHYSVLNGGKRLRPILLLETASLYQVSEREALPPACALELIHCYSLIHDDLPCMDDDDLRRGIPTLHKVFGEDMAVLAGDAILTLAFEIMASSPFPPSLVLRLIRELARFAGYRGMVAGQVEDLEAEGRIIDREGLESIHEKKTGALINCSIRSGAIIGEAPLEELSLLTSFGEKLGLLFQITDDILDVIGKTQSMGKTRGADASRKKATYPSILGLEESQALASQLKEEALEILLSLNRSTQNLMDLTQFIHHREG